MIRVSLYGSRIFQIDTDLETFGFAWSTHRKQGTLLVAETPDGTVLINPMHITCVETMP